MIPLNSGRKNLCNNRLWLQLVELLKLQQLITCPQYFEAHPGIHHTWYMQGKSRLIVFFFVFFLRCPSTFSRKPELFWGKEATRWVLCHHTRCTSTCLPCQQVTFWSSGTEAADPLMTSAVLSLYLEHKCAPDHKAASLHICQHVLPSTQNYAPSWELGGLCHKLSWRVKLTSAS